MIPLRNYHCSLSSARSVALTIMLVCGMLHGTVASAHVADDSVMCDSILEQSIQPDVDEMAFDSIYIASPTKVGWWRRGIIGKFLNYMESQSKPHPDKKFDIGILGGPHYSSDYGFGIGVVATGSYRIGNDSLATPRSRVSLYGDATTGMFFKLGIRGVNFLPGSRARSEYDVAVESFDTYMWGVGYANNVLNRLKTPYKYLKLGLRANFLWCLGQGFYAGPEIDVRFIRSQGSQLAERWPGMDGKAMATAIGLRAQLDTRDDVGEAHRGVMMALWGRKAVKTATWASSFWLGGAEFRAFGEVWRGGVLATRLWGEVTSPGAAWSLLPWLGGQGSMRGYYEGRYRDRGAMEATLELRQHVWRRNGIVLWGGVGQVFHSMSAIGWRRFLPSYGVGYRWAFRPRVNVRFDVGFGRGTSGIVFAIDEAF